MVTVNSGSSSSSNKKFILDSVNEDVYYIIIIDN